MKKIFLIAVAAFFCFSFATNAQSPFKLGVKVGFNASSVTGFEDLNKRPGNFVDTKYKPGFQLGIVAQYDFNANFFLQPEFLFSNQGANFEGESYYRRYDTTIHLNYLQLPVYAGYKINAGTDLDILLGVGPYISYGIYGSDDFFDEKKRFDFGGATMVGVQYQGFQITAGFDFGFIDMSDIEGLDSVSNRNAKVSVISFF